jgi:hypothetical protein
MATQTNSDLLRKIREWAKDPGAVFYTLRGKRGTVAIFPEDVLERTDEQLVDFISKRCSGAG